MLFVLHHTPLSCYFQVFCVKILISDVIFYTLTTVLLSLFSKMQIRVHSFFTSDRDVLCDKNTDVRCSVLYILLYWILIRFLR